MTDVDRTSSGKNPSELLFEEILRTAGFPDFSYEPEIEGTSRRPDYAVTLGDQILFFEVKEFRATANDARLQGGCFDPYPPLREKINAAARKFKETDGRCCNLVLFSSGKPLIFLDWEHIFGAMLGDVGFQIPVSITGLALPETSEVNRVFLAGGKMHHESDGRPVAPKNQTISSIVGLEHLAVGQKRFAAHCRGVGMTKRRELTDDEFCAEFDAAAGTSCAPSIRQLRVVVNENPYAYVPLPEEMFRGPWDERYGGRDGRIGRTYVGAEAAALEALG